MGTKRNTVGLIDVGIMNRFIYVVIFVHMIYVFSIRSGKCDSSIPLVVIFDEHFCMFQVKRKRMEQISLYG